MLANLASGAIREIIPAHAVPWPAESPATDGSKTARFLSTRASTDSITRPARSACCVSIPLSITATVTPLPVAFRQSGLGRKRDDIAEKYVDSSTDIR